MTAKEKLSQYKYKRDRVSQTLEDYEMYKTRAEKMTAIISEASAHTNKVSDKVGDNATIMADLALKYEKRWIEAELELSKLIDSIDNLEAPYRDILYYRYVRLYDFRTVGDQIGYSYDRVIHLHGIALLKYEEVNNV